MRVVIKRRRSVTGLALTALAVGLLQVMPTLPQALAAPGDTLLASSGSGATAAAAGNADTMAVSGDGRYAAFTTTAGLVPEDTNGFQIEGPPPGPAFSTDVYRKDLFTGQTILVSRNVDGIATGRSMTEELAISDDGDYVLSWYVPDPTLDPIQPEIYRHRVSTGARERVDVNFATEATGRGPAFFSLSDDGNRVAFISYAPLVSGAGGSGLYVRDFNQNAVFYVGEVDPTQVAISGDGRHVAYGRTQPDGLDQQGNPAFARYIEIQEFESEAGPRLVNGGNSANLRDLAGLLGPDAISRDGQQVAYWSDGDAFGGNNDPKPRQVWVFDADQPPSDVARLASADASGAFGTAASGGVTNDWPKGGISGDGKTVAFTSQATFGLPGVTGGSFVKDLIDQSIEVASLSTTGAPLGVGATTLSNDGTRVGFVTSSAGAPEDTNGQPDVYVHEIDGPLRDFSLTVAPSAQRAGVSNIDTDEINVALLPVGYGALESAPLRSSPLRSSPLRSSPLRSSPLRSSPLRSSPLRSSPLRSSPLRSSPLRSSPIPLATVPLFLDGGWAALLVGTPYEGAALQSVTLEQVLLLTDTSPGLYPQLEALTLADIDITSTPLRSSPLQAFLFAGVPMGKLSLSSGDFYCSGSYFPGVTCDPATTTLLDLVAQGVTPDDLGFVSFLFVDDADLEGSPIHQYDIGSVDVGLLGMSEFLVGSLPTGMVDMTKCLAGCETLGDVVSPEFDALSDDYTQTGLGRILDQQRPEVSSLRFQDLIRAVVDPSQISYAGVDLDRLVEQGPFDPARFVTYTADATVNCDRSDFLSLEVRLPSGFRYVPGSTTLSFGADQGEYRDPEDGFGEGDRVEVIDAGGDFANFSEVSIAARGDRLYWPLPSCVGARDDLTLTFDASPGVDLGTFTSDARLENNNFEANLYDSVRVDDAAPVTVGDAFDSGPQPASQVEPTIPVLEDNLYVSHISAPDDVDTYQLRAGLPAGTRVTAVLSHLEADFDLFLDGPVAAPLRSSPLRSSPLRSSPIEDLDVPGAQGGDVIEAETLQDVPLRSSFLSQSATAGTEDEQVTTVLTKPTSVDDPATIAVTNHLGTSSTRPYLLQITTEPPIELECPTPGPTVPFLTGGLGTAGTLPNTGSMSAAQKAAVKTLFLVNKERLGDAYTPADADTIISRLTALSSRAEVGGLVLPVDGSALVRAAYDAWDANRCSPEAANDVVRAIGGVVDEYAAQFPQLRYLTFVGDDDILPFARIPDGASVSNQREYHPEVKFGGQDNAISAAFGRGYVLSDNVLLAKEGLEFLGHQLPVPDYAGGRLVETPAEILGTITQYETRQHIVKDKTLVTGYDFLNDLSPVLQKNLTGTAVPEAEQKTDKPGYLNSEVWTRTNLESALGGAPGSGPTVAGINAHYDHSNALPAAGNTAPTPTTELFTSANLRDSALPPGALLFTLGCQGGLSVPGRAWAAAATTDELARLDDFAQVMAQKQASGFLGNTGYGYGDTVLLAYSERFLELFTQYLDGTMTVSQAITKAKQDYLKDGLVGVYDEKVLNEATYYGLPFVTVGPLGTAGPAPTAPVAGPVPTERLFGTPVISRSTGDILYTLRATGLRGSYFTVNNPVKSTQPLVEHWRPIQPAIQETLPAAPAGSIVGDVWFTGLESLADTQPGAFDPVFSAPTVDMAAFSPEPLIRSVAFPVSLGTVTPRGTLALFPGQYRSGETPGLGTQLLFKKMDYKVFYPTSSTAERPTFTSVEGSAGPTGTAFRIGITGAEGATVLGKPVGSLTWVEVPLTQSEPGVWTGATGLQIAEYIVQSANQGRVGTTRSKGVNYTPSEDDATITVAPVGPAVTPVAVDPWSRQPVTITSTEPDVEARLVGGVTGAQSLTTSSTAPEATGSFQPLPLTVTPDGIHEVEYRVIGDTETQSLLVAIDKTAPTATITNPANGGTVTSSNRTATFSCADATSGIASCTALDPVQLQLTAGPHTFRVKAVDRAGGETITTVSYRGVTYVFEGFFSPVDRAPVVNVVQPGSTVPVKFRLKQDGVVVTDTSKVTSIATTQLSPCPNGPSDTLEESAPVSAPGGLVYDATAQRFQYNWKTSKTARGCWRLTFTFADGTSQFALFRFK